MPLKPSYLLFLTIPFFANSVECEAVPQFKWEHLYSIKAGNCGGTNTQARALSGFRVADAPLKGIVTALHGVVGCTAISATNVEARQVFVDLEIKMADVEADIALLSSATLEASAAAGLHINYNVQWNNLTKVWIFGFPYRTAQHGDNLEFRIPRLRQLKGELGDALSDLVARKSPDIKLEIVSLAGTIAPGHSGAPILSEDGNVIAIGNGGLRGGASNVGWAIPFKNVSLKSKDSIKRDLDELAKKKSAELFAFEYVDATKEELIGCSFGTGVTVGQGTFERILTGDWNGDRRDDLAYVYSNRSGNLVIQPSIADELGAYESQKIYETGVRYDGGENTLFGVLAANVSNDEVGNRRDEIVHYHTESGRLLLRVFKATADGKFEALPAYRGSSIHYYEGGDAKFYGVRAGDFNGDGLIDLIHYRTDNTDSQKSGGGLIFVTYLSRGDGTFDGVYYDTKRHFSDGMQANSKVGLVVANLNRESDHEEAMCADMLQYLAEPAADNSLRLTLLTYQSDCEGHFLAESRFETPYSFTGDNDGVVIGNFNGSNPGSGEASRDKLDDIVLYHSDASGRLEFYSLFTRENGGFDIGPRLEASRPLVGDTSVFGVLSADLNGDGRQDIVHYRTDPRHHPSGSLMTQPYYSQADRRFVAGDAFYPGVIYNNAIDTTFGVVLANSNNDRLKDLITYRALENVLTFERYLSRGDDGFGCSAAGGLTCDAYQATNPESAACNMETDPGFYWKVTLGEAPIGGPGKVAHWSEGGASSKGEQPPCNGEHVGDSAYSARFPYKHSFFQTVHEEWVNGSSTDTVPGCNYEGIQGQAGAIFYGEPKPTICGIFRVTCSRQPRLEP